MTHPLLTVLLDAAAGRFPRADGDVETMAPERPGDLAAIEFTGHAVVLTDADPAELVALGADGFGGVTRHEVIRHLAGPAGWIGSHDVVLAARGTGGGGLPERSDLEHHPRVVRSRRHRRDVRVFGDADGLVTIGAGLVGRTELSVERFDPDGTDGAGRRLVRGGLRHVAAGEVVFAQVAPGNAASLRSFLAAGFVPIGAETLIHPVIHAG